MVLQGFCDPFWTVGGGELGCPVVFEVRGDQGVAALEVESVAAEV